MRKVKIYEFQLKAIKEALRISARIHNSKEGVTCHDRQVRQSLQYAENALEGNIDKEVPYMGVPYKSRDNDQTS